MSTKHLRRKLLEKEEADAKDSVETEQQSPGASDDNESGELGTKRVNLFELLNEDEDTDANHADSQTPIAKQTLSTNKNKQIKPARKKKKNKKQSEKVVAENEDFDAVLKEYGSASATGDNISDLAAGTEGTTAMAESKLFEIEFRNLDPEVEIKRMLGQRLGNVHRQTKQRGLGGKLVQPKSNWGVVRGSGLSMKLVAELPNGVKQFTFEHSTSYQTAQKLFWEAVEGSNPDVFVVRFYVFYLLTVMPPVTG